MLRKGQILAIALLVVSVITVFPNLAFAQTNFESVDCPPGTHERAQSGGGIVCIDDTTGQVVNPEDYFSYQLGGETGTYIAIGIVVLFIIIAIAAAAARSGKEKPGERRGFVDSVKKEVLRLQDHKCNVCNRLLDVVDYDHKDGDSSNNDISNCQALCPNCHAKKSRKAQMGLDDE